ncbi:SusE domain-containing protein [Flavobacterium algicola]|uniref:SusE domain-containing protein n=1 Tax=Flavobacterium algicola TaxID=556529 RepID=UPI001EFC2DF2|nr:SusE domain-containing protein [Flavobacterium algicola]MCG9791847.1 SusE domain-containing protein [Flavobacterium algicola]
MKKINQFLFAFISILAVSCTADDVENKPILSKISTPEITAPATAKQYLLTEVNADTDVDKFVWTAAQYSESVVVQYSLVMDVSGGDFSIPQTLATTSNVTQAAVTVKTLNQAAIELGALPGTPKQFDVKVMASVSGGVPTASAKVITISVNTYSGLIAYPFTDWYLVGDATVSGWDNNNNNQPLFRGGTNPKEYRFTGYFKAGYFKTISTLGQWAPMYGKGDNGTIVSRAKDADPDPASFEITTAGYYTFTMNTETLKYTLVAYDASAASSYARIGFLGSSRTGTDAGWSGDDTAMTKSTFDGHLWTLKVTLFDGKGKFRANNAWDKSWGGDTAFAAFPTQGTSSGDIPVARSKYKVLFNDLDGIYMMFPNQE